VLADPSQLQQVVMNLSANAEHAMRGQGGTLEVALDVAELAHPQTGYPRPVPAGSWVRLRVSDSGRGMERAVTDRMFEPFYTTKPVGEGTGMGLAVVHGTVEACGGVVTVDSELGRGTTVSVYLPLAQAPERLEQLRSSPVRGTESVLFVDDESALALLGREMLQWLGYRVEAFESSTRALEAFRLEPRRFDIIVTDQTMPGLSGDALAREARRVRPDIPVILCTGFSHTLTPEQAAELGIDAYLYKPLVAEELGAAIREVLAARARV
jgi:CheY-like chemotaxis protein